MTSAYLNQFLLPLENSDQDPSRLKNFSSLAQTSLACPQHVLCHGRPYEHNGVALIDYGTNTITLYSATTNSSNSENISQPSDDEQRREGEDGSLKWMPSKMRWMKKMLATDHKVAASGATGIPQATQIHQLLSQDSSNSSKTTTSSPSDVTRVCSDCKTTRTPLWRTGPQGPKSLCNACGIRQRKARRAMGVAAAASGGAFENAEIRGKVQKKKLPELENYLLPFKKRCKITTKGSTQKKMKFNEDNKIISLRSDSAVHRVLPEDERDAAILLMALSCGIMYG